jgi:hypothetical protein
MRYTDIERSFYPFAHAARGAAAFGESLRARMNCVGIENVLPEDSTTCAT